MVVVYCSAVSRVLSECQVFKKVPWMFLAHCSTVARAGSAGQREIFFHMQVSDCESKL